FKKEWIEVKLSDLDKRFEAADEITPQLMVERGMIKKSHLARFEGVVILGGGEGTKALNRAAHRFSRGAREKIKAAGGKVTLIARTPGASAAESQPPANE